MKIINELEHRSGEIIQTGIQKENINEKTEIDIQDLWNNIKTLNDIWMIEI